jgi:hypothetical protein
MISDVVSHIDWATLSLNGPTVTWGSRYEASYTNAKNNVDPFNPQIEKSGFNLGGVSTTNSIINATGYGYSATSPSDWVAAEAHSVADGLVTTHAEASASVHRRDWFTVAEDGALTLSLDYSFWHSLQGGAAGESGSAYSVASLVLLGPQNDFDNPIDRDEFDFSQNSLGVYQADGSLTLSGELKAGEWYSIEAHIYGANNAESPLVPEPTTIMLFGIGIVMISVTARRASCS